MALYLNKRGDIKRAIHHSLSTFDFVVGAYGITRANEKIQKSHLYITVDTTKIDLQNAKEILENEIFYLLGGAHEEIEILEFKKHPKFKWL